MADAKRFKAPRGADDILPENQAYWRLVRETATRVAESFGYGEIETPIFEHKGVFLRPGAEGTDVADKEIYLFEDRGGDELALRPEGTAGVVRAYVEHGMASMPQPVRLFYFVSIFRYDRPQAGRYRVRHQFGVEAIGDPGPSIDVEVIQLLHTFYRELGLGEVSLQLNSIGDGVCRPGYIEKLRAYYADKLNQLCGDCRRRYDVNPLRMLDCKNEPCQPFKAAAPKLPDNLCDDCRAHFDSVKEMLAAVGINYVLNPTLVRGLDYYTRTTFEFQPAIEGSQSTIGAGGRYDGLVEQLGGPSTPGIGFGTGIERIILNLKRQEVSPPRILQVDAYVAVADEAAAGYALRSAEIMRDAGKATVVAGSAGRSLKAQLRQAGSLNARFAVIIGVRERDAGLVTLRDLSLGQETQVTVDEATERIRSSTTI